MNLGAAMYTSADGEHKQEVPGRLAVGEVPDWLSGCLIRNGPGLYEVGDTAYRHFFDGMAMLQKFSIGNGSVSYSSQFIRSDTYLANKANNRIVVSEFGTAAFPDPCKSLLGRFAAIFAPSEEEQRLKQIKSDNTVVNVFAVGDQIFAATETPRLNRIDPRSLDRVEQMDFRRHVTVNTVTAHPHFDSDGSVLNLGSAFEDKDGPKYLIVRVPQGDLGKTEVVASIKARWRWHPSYYHSFGISQNYFIFVEAPLVITVWRALLASFSGGTFDNILQWYDGYDSLIHVYNRHDGSHVQTFTAPAFFTFHHMNAFEDADGVIQMDVCTFNSGEVIHQQMLPELRKLDRLPRSGLQLRRYHLTLGSKELVSFTAPAEGSLALEFPQINYRFNAAQYRYGYGVGTWQQQPSLNSQILKLDWSSESVLEWHLDECEPSETIFVERPGASAEDDGVLLSSIIRYGDKRSLFLLILDAADFSEIARVDFDGVSVPRDIHGAFFTDQQLSKVAEVIDSDKRQ